MDDSSNYNLQGIINLLSAVALSGINEHDTEFLQSDWYAYIIDVVTEYAKEKDYNSNKAVVHFYTTNRKQDSLFDYIRTLY